MSKSKEQRLDETHRLLAMREFLRVQPRPDDQEFEPEVVRACVRKIQPIIDLHSRSRGETIVAAIAQDVGVKFEEVKGPADIQSLKRKYLVEQRELGFGRLEDELSDPSVDALLFQRVHARHGAPDRWIAVINLQGTSARAYWSRPHEILHRLAEPPQQRLPFYRHREDHGSRVERIIDLGAAELAFPKVAYGKLVQGVADRPLTWDLVQAVRKAFAPSSSLQAAAKAFLRYWPHPAFLVMATVRGRLRHPAEDVALRIDVDGFSSSTEHSGARFVRNMRVPTTSPIFRTHKSADPITDFENLGRWTTSQGYALPQHRAFTSSIRLGSVTYGLISIC